MIFLTFGLLITHYVDIIFSIENCSYVFVGVISNLPSFLKDPIDTCMCTEDVGARLQYTWSGKNSIPRSTIVEDVPRGGGPKDSRG